MGRKLVGECSTVGMEGLLTSATPSRLRSSIYGMMTVGIVARHRGMKKTI